MLNLFKYIALRHLKMRPGRTAFSVAGIACGIALFVAISIINESTSGFFRESMTAVSGKASLTISGGELGFDEKLGELIEKVEGVTDAIPVVETRSWLLSSNESLMILGVDLLQEKNVRSYKAEGKPIIGDSMTFITAPDSVILTEGFVKSHGLKMNDTIELSTSRGKAKFKVRGVLSPTGLATAYGGGMAIMDIDVARIAFGKEGKTDRIDVMTKKDADIDKVIERIQAVIGPTLSVERPEMHSEQMDRTIKSFQFMSHFFSTLALIVGVFLIYNSVSISVAERRKEIGTLRALGTKRNGILVLFMSEAFAMGAIGAFIGAFLGRALASFMVGSVTRAMTNQFMQKIEATDLKFTGMTVLSAVLIGSIASVIAAFWPSYKATEVEPVEAMRRKDTGEESRKSGFSRYSGWLGFAMLLFSAIASFLITDSNSPTLQISMQLASILGSALLGPALVIWAVGLVRPIIVKRTTMVPRLAMDNLLRNPKRTSTNVTSLMVGLTLVVVIACVNKSFKGTLVKFFGRILHADLVISTTGKLQSHNTQPLEEALQPKIAANPGVLGVIALREVKVRYEGKMLMLKYYGEPPVPEAPADPKEAPPQRYDIFDTIDRSPEEGGHAMFHSPDPVVMVSDNFVVHFKKKTGDKIMLDTHKGPQEFRIVGVNSEFANPNGTLFMSRDQYLKYFNDRLVSGFAVKLKRGFDPVEVRKQLDKELSKEYKLTIMLNSDIRSQVATVIDNSFAYTKSIEVAALLVGLLGLMNTLLITVMERTRELGLVRALGMTRGHVSKMILIEAGAQGGLGAIIAMVLGTGVAVLWVTQNLAHSLGWVVSFYFPWDAVIKTFGLGLVVTLVAAWYPAHRASGINIVDALDHE